MHSWHCYWDNEQTLEHTALAEQIKPDLPDIYLIKGLAHCNLEQYTEAEAAYSRALELNPDFNVLYGLRAQTWQQSGDLVGAVIDLNRMSQADLGNEFEALVREGALGRINCNNFFDP